MGKRPIILALLLLQALFSCAAFAQRNLKIAAKEAPAATTEVRVALVIGNAAYKESPLSNPVNDATDIAKALQDSGFRVILKRNAGTRDMRQAIREFGAELRRADVGLFYFAGHGIQIKGNNYLVPVGADIQNEADAEDLAIDAAYALRTMEDAQVKVSIVVLDACRNNPFSRSFRSASRGLAQMNAATGSVIAFATAPGSVAADGAGRNGVYTKHLLASLAQPDTDVLKVVQRTRANVYKETGGRQTPWESTSLIGDFYFRPSKALGAAPASPHLASAAPSSQSIKPGAAEQASQVRVDALPRTQIAIADFAGEAQSLPGLLAVLRGDLERSGVFRMVDAPSRGLTEASVVNYEEWQGRSAEALVMGSVGERPDGRFDIRFRLYDIAKRMPLGGIGYTASREQMRATAHRIADFVHERLSGDKGVFSSRLAYVAKGGDSYQLFIADADGANPEHALRSREAISSPVFSPDGRRLAYVSYEHSRPGQRRPVAYAHSLIDGKRVVSLNPTRGPFTAMTLAWAPDQKTLAVLARSDEGTLLYSVTPEGADMKVIGSSTSEDADPAFSPDGAWIYFTSNRSGSRQIHRMPANGGAAERVSLGRNESYSPAISPDGKTLAYITRENGADRLAAMDLSSGRVSVLAESALDQKPSFAPNGRYVIFAAEAEGQRVLRVASVNGREVARWILRSADSALGEPVWGPIP
jgi:TolB protein